MVEVFGHPTVWLVISVLSGVLLALISHAVIPMLMSWRWNRRLRDIPGVKKIIWQWNMLMIFAETKPPKDPRYKWPQRTLWYRIDNDEQLRILD